MKRSFLRDTRHKRKLTLKQTASQLGIHKDYLGHIERGTKNPSLHLACKMEKFFNIPICTLLKQDGDDAQ